MKVIVFGYHNIGYVCLAELIAKKEDVLAVFTHTDNPNENIWFNSVAQLAKLNNIPVYTPENINTDKWVTKIQELNPDIIFSFYYRNMISKQILDIPKLGCINLHGSYLPKYRGRCPVNWAIINGETQTGVTLHYMEEKPDKGDIVAQKKVAIDFEDTAFTLFSKMTAAAKKLFSETFPLIKEDRIVATVQDQAKASYFGGRKPSDGKINWNSSALQIYNLVRAVTHPYPGAFTTYNSQKLIVWNCQITEEDVLPNEKPGTILKIIPEKGILVATKDKKMLLREAQFENNQEDNIATIAISNNFKLKEQLL